MIFDKLYEWLGDDDAVFGAMILIPELLAVVLTVLVIVADKLIGFP